MPSKDAMDVLTYLDGHEDISRQDFQRIFPQAPHSLLQDLAKTGYLENAHHYHMSSRQRTPVVETYVYDSYRISDYGRAYLSDYPKAEKRAHNAEIRANISLIISLLALLLSAAAIAWQVLSP